MNKVTLNLLIVLIFSTQVVGQSILETDPLQAKFVLTDIPLFWQCFDQLETTKDPFSAYLKKGSAGLKDFVPYRIESSKNLLKKVKARKADYLAIRENSTQIHRVTDSILIYFQAFKQLYGAAVFPTTYFVMGAFNSGGTSTKTGLIIGVEMQTDINRIPVIVAHELIHFNQQYPPAKINLLRQSIMEGSADFLAELIVGAPTHHDYLAYFRNHEAALCAEFVQIMYDKQYKGWLYGSMGKKADRPNDLGYAMGYQITAAYYQQATNKQEAIRDILNIRDFDAFLAASGYLKAYMD